MNERHVRVLHMVAEAYIATAHPVPSLRIAEQLDVSSATVRNDFGTLEEGGLLQQPHTSAGRIPTALGFRNYALSQLPPKRMPGRWRSNLKRQLSSAEGDELFALASKLAAEMSGYAVLIRLPDDQTLNILEIHLSLLSSRRLLAVVVLENGLVRQIGIDLDPAPSESVIDDAERNLRQLTLPVSEVPGALRAIADRTEPELSRTLRAVAEAWGGLQQPRQFRDGLSRLLAEPEGQDPRFVRLVVEQVEADTASAASWHDGLGIELDDSLARVTAAFSFGSGQGTLTLLGPARMRYPTAFTLAQELGDALSRGLLLRGKGAEDDAFAPAPWGGGEGGPFGPTLS